MDLNENIELIRRLEESLTFAEKNKNESTLNKLLADNFTGITSDGKRVNKEEFIRNCVSIPLDFSEFEIRNVKIEVAESTAFVFGETHFSGSVSGTEIKGIMSYCDIWVKREGQYLLKSAVLVKNQ